MIFSIDISVFFNSTTLNVSEDVGSVTIVLLSTNPSSTDITIQVMSNDSNAIGKDANITSN